MTRKWHRGMASLIPPEKHHHYLHLTAGYDTDLPIKAPQLFPYDTYRTLGAYLSPSGNTDKAFEVLKAKALDYAAKIHSSSQLSNEATLRSYILYLCLNWLSP
jgi:hypothetical protein